MMAKDDPGVGSLCPWSRTKKPDSARDGHAIREIWIIGDQPFDLADEPSLIILSRASYQKAMVKALQNMIADLRNELLAELLPGNLEILNPRLEGENEAATKRPAAREDRLILRVSVWPGSARDYNLFVKGRDQRGFRLAAGDDLGHAPAGQEVYNAD
jgi:hypothetical protein